MGSPGETRAVAARQAAERRAEGVEKGEEEKVDGGSIDGAAAASADFLLPPSLFSSLLLPQGHIDDEKNRSRGLLEEEGEKGEDPNS